MIYYFWCALIGHVHSLLWNVFQPWNDSSLFQCIYSNTPTSGSSALSAWCPCTSSRLRQRWPADKVHHLLRSRNLSTWRHFDASMALFFFLALILLTSTGSTCRSHGSVIARFFFSLCLFPPCVATANHAPPCNPALFYFYISASSSHFRQLQHRWGNAFTVQTSRSDLIGVFSKTSITITNRPHSWS